MRAGNKGGDFDLIASMLTEQSVIIAKMGSHN